MEPFAGVTVAATKSVDKLTANLGDTLNYTVVISDSSLDATGVSFSDTLETDLTFVPGSLQVSPIAVNDAYTCTGNLSISIPAGVGLLANDYTGLNPAATITAYDAVSLNGGAVSVAADGSFTYAPAAGYTGTDTFTYTLLNTTGTSTGTVSIAVSGMIWFINNAPGACTSSCDGRLSHPFMSLANFLTFAGGGNGGDRIFIYSGAGGYAGNLTLKLNQRLIGQGDALNATTLGFTPAPYGPALPGAGTKPTLTGTLTLATGVTVLAVNLSTDTSNGMVGTGVTGVTVGDQCTVTTTTGTAVSLTNSDGAFTFLSVSANGGANGIVWNNATQAAGSLAVSGSGSAGSGGTIQNMGGSDGSVAGCGVYLNKASNVSLSYLTMNNFANYGIRGFSVNNFTMNQCAITGTSGTSATENEGCVSFGANTGEPGGPANGLTGSATVSTCTISGGYEDNFRVTNQSGSLNRLSFTGTTLGPNSVTTGNDGILIEGESAALLNVTVQGCTFSGARGSLFALILNGNNTADLVFQNNNLSNPAAYSGSAGSNGLSLISGNNIATGAFTTFNISNNTFRDANGHAVLMAKSTDPGTLSGTINNNTIGVQATSDSGSAAGDGIKIQNAGLGTVTVSVTNNRIYQYNNFGVELLTGGGASAMGGALNATVSGNTISNPGTGGLPMNGVHLNGGTVVGDTYQICADILNNSLVGSGANGGTDFRLRQRQSTTVRLPGYGGANNDNAAVVTYLQGKNPGGPTGLASNTVGSGGGGFVGGVACAQPSTFGIPVSGDGTARDERLAAVTEGQLASLVQEALVRLALAGVPPEQLARLEKIRVRLGDLPVGLVAEGYPEEIVLDRSAAGRAWFVDPTPYDDAEFEEVLSDGSIRAGETSPARPGVDLLSVLLACFANEAENQAAEDEMGMADGVMAPAPTGEPAAPAETDAVRRLREFLPEAGVRCLPLAPHAPEAPAQDVLQPEPAPAPPAAVAPPRAESRTESGETVSVTIGALPAGKSVVIKFAAVIANPLAVPATQVTNQGTVSGSNFSTVLTNIATTAIPCPGVPAVTGISPSTGPQVGGTTVTITGSGFLGATSVTFGATPAASYLVNGDTSITAVSPAGTGIVDVRVSTPCVTSAATGADQFTYRPAPVVITALPSAGPEAGGTVVTITGSGFTGATAVTFGPTPAASFSVVDDSTIQAVTPPGGGTVEVHVTTPGGMSAANPPLDRFTYLPVPVLYSVFPSAGPQAGGTTVTINGIGFVGAAAVNFGATPAASFWLVNDTTIQAVSPAGTGIVDVTVTTPGGTSSITLADRFSYCSPIAFSPATLPGGVKGAAYSQTITATGGVAPYTFALTSGALPNGLSLDPGGALTGTPSVPNTFSFTVTATDSAGCTGSQAYSMTIACATLVTNLSDSGEGSLRWAVGNACIGNTITFAPGLTGAIQLTSGAIPITFALTIQGPGALVLAVDGGGLDRVFYYFNNPTGTLSLSGLTIQNGAASTHGGGIYAASPLALADCVVSGCVTSTGTNAGGGGIYAQGGLTMDRCTVSGNQMTGGGYGGGLEVNTTPGVLTNCTFSGNHAPGSGGGVMVANTTCTLLNCTVTQNSVPAVNPGGGIAVINGTLNLQNSIVAGNAGQAGLQIFNSASTVNDNGGNVTSGDPLVAPLADYGGETPTHALLCGSPALNIAVAGYPATDQRSVPRPQAGAADSGAFEANIFMGPSSLPGGQTGTPYSQNLTATGGTAPYTFTPVGSLPAWLSLAADGSLTGTPTALGSWTFSALAMDSQGFIGACSYTVAVTCGTVTVVNPAVSSGIVNAPFSQVFTQSGGQAPVTYTTSSALPTGITLATDGTLSGTPTVNGTFPITVTATDTNGCVGTGAVYSLVISCPAISLAALANGTANTAYSSSAAASPTGTYTYAVTAGSLPPGLTLNTSTGAVTGTPTTNGAYNFTITAAGWGTCTGSQGYSVTISCPTITLAALAAAGTANTPYSSSAAASPAGTYTYAVTAGSLPPGLTLNTSTGAVTGTPTANGTYNFSITATGWGTCTGSQAYVLTIACPTITLAALATTGTANTPYSSSAAASPAGTYTYALTAGSLPPGLTLSPSTGAVTGTPTTNGTYTFTITATGWGTCTGSQAYSVVISCPTITLAALTATGTANTPYSSSAMASPAGTYTYAVTAGSLPPGLTLNPATGAVTGTPTTNGTYNFTINATGWGTCTGSQAYILTIACPTITLSPGSPLPNATVGSPYSETFSASPAGTTYTFAVTAGSLPPGLTLNPASGALSGTVTAAGSSTFTVTATGWGTCAGGQTYTLQAVCPSISVNPASIPAGTVGAPYAQTFTASGGYAPYTYSVSGGSLPPGLTLSVSGALSGTPSLAGSYTFTVSASDKYLCAGTRSLTVTMVCPAITLTPETLPAGQVGLSYAATLAAAGGTAPYAFTVTAGTLPPGLTLAAGGTLSGTPTAGGTFTFTVTATDTFGCSGSRSYTIAISAFDLSFYDDTGRSRVCVNSITGSWRWTVLQGVGVGTYTGGGTASWVNNVLTITSKPGAPFTFSLRYMKLYSQATGSYSNPSLRIRSLLTDSNTKNDPPGC